jgi:diguanylate cyclase (GGDEF)-like protein/PAS domain S-box-containing protein
VYFALPSLLAKDLLYDGVGVLCVVAIVAGVRRNAPARRLPWYLFAAGNLLFAIADAIWNIDELVLHHSPFPSIADAFYLAGYPFIAAGLLLLIGRRNLRNDRAGLVDGAMLATGLGVLAWVFLLLPYVQDATLSWAERSISIAYPVMDVVLLAIAARLVLGGGSRGAAYRYICGGLVAFLMADAVYPFLQLRDAYASGNPIDAGWLASYLLWGVAALHPSMRRLHAAPHAPPNLTRRRIALLAFVSLVGPATILLEPADVRVANAPVVAAGSAIIALLVLVRMALMVREVAFVKESESRNQIRLQAEALKAAANMIVITDGSGVIEYVNPAFTAVTGYAPEDVLGHRMDMLEPTHDRASAQRWQTVAGGRPWRGEIVSRRKDGSVYPEEQTITPIHDADGAVTNVVAVKDDITERKRQEDRLSFLAQHDSLTGLLNRSALAEHLRRAVAAGRRGRPSALLYLDLDQFKIVNDTLGHAAGDRLLITLAGLLLTSVREEDVLARLGGDEFALLMHGVGIEQAVQIASKLRSLVGDFRFSEGNKIFDVDVSIGVATIDGHATDGEVLAQADMACYAAKARGRNRVELYEAERSEQVRLTSDAEWTVRIKDALRDGRLHLHFQPIVSVREQSLRHYEVLVRLETPDGETVLPGAFIPAAERFGLVHEIDRWVIRAALERLDAEHAAGNPIHLAINLSGLSFHEEPTLQCIKDELAARNIDPRLLTFEITETAAITNITQARRFIDALRDLGCNFALDDFGSGFSSFAYLRYLPVDFVKIDGAFIRQLPKDTVNQVMVRSMNEAAHSLGIGTIAEFVEDQTILDTLRDMGVDFAQGYHIGHPSPNLTQEPVPAYS